MQIRTRKNWLAQRAVGGSRTDAQSADGHGQSHMHLMADGRPEVGWPWPMAAMMARPAGGAGHAWPAAAPWPMAAMMARPGAGHAWLAPPLAVAHQHMPSGSRPDQAEA